VGVTPLLSMLQLRQPKKAATKADQHSPSCPRLPAWSVSNASGPTINLKINSDTILEFGLRA